ncbi:MAG: flagellar motor protein MotA [Candidatus Melainabacteria bacterium RIFOXYA12_FULL_32_12]|nr:MAG: flagellar motor protein MotA [Candidatus Melainabacteria bacterium RIFOXYA2_FULL_32_9]OGI31024.1 MAG: flagellar motor protein MotA [Candidatus Melainabacteria bacterium RIFOXYA12_FULL_32_12]
MDLTSILGIVIGLGCILIGQALEGGSMQSLIQITAAFIVFGGTAGAVILSYPQQDLQQAVKELKTAFFNKKNDYEKVIAEVVGYAMKARKEGVIVLEKEARNASDPLMKLGLEAVSDGADPVLVRDLMETQLFQLEERVTRAAKVWESAGGYSPTIGIIGAVLGLIQVMQNLADPSKLGAGIAVAFVATVYGVGAANLILIPLGSKIKFKSKQDFLAKEIMIEGILSIQAGESPALIERKLQAFLLDKKDNQVAAKPAKA